MKTFEEGVFRSTTDRKGPQHPSGTDPREFWIQLGAKKMWQ